MWGWRGEGGPVLEWGRNGRCQGSARKSTGHSRPQPQPQPAAPRLSEPTDPRRGALLSGVRGACVDAYSALSSLLTLEGTTRPAVMADLAALRDLAPSIKVRGGERREGGRGQSEEGGQMRRGGEMGGCMT